jgi:outer membrane protein assembly factor BamD (BamD/ComL family)
MRAHRVVILVALAALVFSCASAPVPAPEGLTPAELIQKAQDATDRNKEKQALVYYQAILERFPADINSVCAAEYEIAFIQYKGKDYETAKSGFRALLDRYKGEDAALLPAQYKILSEKILAKIELKKK